MENISDLGFNFVRVPLDTQIFFDWDDPSKVHLEKLVNLDELISWGAEYGVHVCIDVHSTFGFATNGEDENDTIWNDPEEQELFISFWDMLAERYKDIPNGLLSFNLMNEPKWEVTEEQYAELMRRTMDAIRVHTLERLIFVDMMNTATEPVYSLVEDRVAQSFHFYEPRSLTHVSIDDDFGAGYPVISGKGMIERAIGTSDFVIEGDFPAGTEISFNVNGIHLGGTLHMTADGNEVLSHEYTMEAVGENGCVSIEEEGTGGENRWYDNTLSVILPEDASTLRLYTTGDSLWFNLNKMHIHAGQKQYVFEESQKAWSATTNIRPNPHIVIDEDGTITDQGDIFFSVVDGEYIRSRFMEYKSFSEKTGVAVMLQEFGVYYQAPYDLTLIYLNDLLDAANTTNLNWCGWGYFGPFNFYAVSEHEVRAGATYKKFSNGSIATEMLEIYQNHLTQ